MCGYGFTKSALVCVPALLRRNRTDAGPLPALARARAYLRDHNRAGMHARYLGRVCAKRTKYKADNARLEP